MVGTQKMGPNNSKCNFETMSDTEETKQLYKNFASTQKVLLTGDQLRGLLGFNSFLKSMRECIQSISCRSPHN